MGKKSSHKFWGEKSVLHMADKSLKMVKSTLLKIEKSLE